MRDAIAVVCVLWVVALLVLAGRERLIRDEHGTYLPIRLGRRTWLMFGRWRP